MIQDEAITYRILLCAINAISLAAAIFILVIVFKINLTHERQGKLITSALFFETLFTFFFLMSQFYFDESNTYIISFTIGSSSVGCKIIGFINLFCSIGYYIIIDIYDIELLEIIDQSSQWKGLMRIIAAIIVSLILASVALAFGELGFNNLGMCSLLNYYVNTIIIISFLSISCLLTIGTIIYIQRISKEEMLTQSLKSAHIQTQKLQKLKVNRNYLITFILTRILPMLTMNVYGEFATIQMNSRIYYVLGIPISMGGLLLCIIRAQEPIISQFLNDKYVKPQPRTSQQVQLEISLEQMTNSKSGINSSCNESVQGKNNSQTVTLNQYLTLLSTQRSSSIFYRLTVGDTDVISQNINQKIQENKPICHKLEILSILPIIHQMVSNQEQQQFQSKTKFQVTPYEMRLLRQIRQNNIVCTSYAENIFNQILPISIYQQSFMNNISEHENQQITLYITTDGQVVIEQINRVAKSFLTRYFLRHYYEVHRKGESFFIANFMGLYSICCNDKNYNLIIYQNSINLSQLELKGYKVGGIITFQNGVLTMDLKIDYKILKHKLKLQKKDEFLQQINSNLAFFREHYLWGYSFNIVYLENQNVLQMEPRMFRTCKGFLMASFDNLFDQFYLNELQIEKIWENQMNADYYATNLLMSIDKLI